MSANLLLMFKAVIIAIVEGITEFLPISSTGHMIIVGNLINFKGDFANLFEVVIQLGAILAIVVLYWKKIWTTVVEFFTGKERGLRFWGNILAAFIPAAILGVLFNDKIDALLFKPLPVAMALIFGAILMIVIENRFRHRYRTDDVDKVNVKQAIFIGIFQCLALWPGMSRSASTIMGAWIAGLSTVAAAEFSFFLALPTMVAASGWTLIKSVKSGFVFTQGEVITLIVGFIVAFLVALIVVEKFIKYLKEKPMKGFAVYRLIVGFLIVVLFYAHLI